MKLTKQILLATLPLATLWPAYCVAADPLDANIIVIRQVDPRSATHVEPHAGDKPYAGPVTDQVNASPARKVLNATGDLDDQLLGATHGSAPNTSMLSNSSTPGLSNIAPSAMPTPSMGGSAGAGAGGIAGSIQQGLSSLNHLPGM